MWKRLGICENDCTIDLSSPRLCSNVKKYASPQIAQGLLVYLAQWFLKYGLNPSKGSEWSKKGRAETVQTGVVYFQRYYCLFACGLAREKRVDC